MSATATTGLWVSSRAVRSRSSPERAVSATRAPARSRARAVAAPIPRDAPVTRAVRPSSENGSMSRTLGMGRTGYRHGAMTDKIRLEIEGAIATITNANVDKHNAFDDEMDAR